MKIFPFCLMVLTAAVPAGAAPAGGAKGEVRVAPAAPPPEIEASAALPAGSRFVYGTPDEQYPYYAGVPQELWPFRNTEPYSKFFVTRM